MDVAALLHGLQAALSAEAGGDGAEGAAAAVQPMLLVDGRGLARLAAPPVDQLVDLDLEPLFAAGCARFATSDHVCCGGGARCVWPCSS